MVRIIEVLLYFMVPTHHGKQNSLHFPCVISVFPVHFCNKLQTSLYRHPAIISFCNYFLDMEFFSLIFKFNVFSLFFSKIFKFPVFSLSGVTFQHFPCFPCGVGTLYNISYWTDFLQEKECNRNFYLTLLQFESKRAKNCVLDFYETTSSERPIQDQSIKVKDCIYIFSMDQRFIMYGGICILIRIISM